MKSRDEQVPVVLVPIDTIMGTREFALGVIDVRAGRGYRSGYATWATDPQWCYERGRQWATAAPRSVALKCNGRITAEAVRWYIAAGIT